MKVQFNVSELNPKYHFEITGASFIAEPVDGTMLFITGKIKYCLKNMAGHKNCLVFVQSGIDVPEEMQKENYFVFSDNPQWDYAELAIKLSEQVAEENSRRKYTQTSEGYLVGEGVTIGSGAVIEPNCLIDHGVTIGANARIRYGTVIRNAVIGDDFSCFENSIIGTDSFFFAEKEGREVRIPSFGKVIIGSHVDIGAHVVIERGFNRDTVLKDYVKLDSQVSLGHDDMLDEHVTMTCGAKLAGLVSVGRNTYIGVGASIHQRLNIGSNVLVGMGAVVMTNVKDNTKVMGNPAKKYSV